MWRSSTEARDAASLTARARVARGFSLLEVLVAFVVLTLVTTALFRLFSGALGNASVADEYSRASLFAESRLALAASAPKLSATTEQGVSDDGRLSWATTVEPYTAPDTVAARVGTVDIMPTRLWKVGVTVTWANDRGGSRALALSTVRIGPKE